MALPPTSDQNQPDKPANRVSAEQDVLLREIDQAVRQDQLTQAARRYGWAVIVLIGAALAGFAAYLWWQAREEARLEQDSETLIRALDHVEAGNLATADTALAPLARAGAEGARASSQLLQAGIALQQGRKSEAIRLYAAVAGDADAPRPYRDLAAIREVAANFDAMSPADVVARLKPLAVPGNPWFGSAGELVGIAYLKQGKPELAGPLLAAIARSDDVPETLRARARQLSGLLGVDAVIDADITAPAGAPAKPEFQKDLNP